MNSASPELALRFQRSRVNQPDPAFPQSPGIILKRSTSILLFAARFVLSMNCNDSSRNFISAHKLICTVYSPKIRGEQTVNKLKTPMNSRLLAISQKQLFTAKRQSKTDGEQVVEKDFRPRKQTKVILQSKVRRLGESLQAIWWQRQETIENLFFYTKCWREENSHPQAHHTLSHRLNTWPVSHASLVPCIFFHLQVSDRECLRSDYLIAPYNRMLAPQPTLNDTFLA